MTIEVPTRTSFLFGFVFFVLLWKIANITGRSFASYAVGPIQFLLQAAAIWTVCRFVLSYMSSRKNSDIKPSSMRKALIFIVSAFPIFFTGMGIFLDGFVRQQHLESTIVSELNNESRTGLSENAPLKVSWPIVGELELVGGDGYAYLKVPVVGRKHCETAWVKATKTSGNWSIDKIKMERR